MRVCTPHLGILLIALSVLCIETSSAQDTPEHSSSDEETIRALENQERTAVLSRDVEALKRIWSEHFMVNNPSNRVSPNRDVPLDKIQAGLIHYASFDRNIEALRIDGDVGFVMGAETITPAGNAPRAGQTIHRLFTHVWKRDGQTWRLVARHANVLPAE